MCICLEPLPFERFWGVTKRKVLEQTPGSGCTANCSPLCSPMWRRLAVFFVMRGTDCDAALEENLLPVGFTSAGLAFPVISN